MRDHPRGEGGRARRLEVLRRARDELRDQMKRQVDDLDTSYHTEKCFHVTSF